MRALAGARVSPARPSVHRIKGGGKDGTKSPKERLFALVKYKGAMTLRYYDPKKTGKELGQIELTKDGKVKKGSKKDPTGYDKKVRAPPPPCSKPALPLWKAIRSQASAGSDNCGGDFRSQRRTSSS